MEEWYVLPHQILLLSDISKAHLLTLPQPVTIQSWPNHKTISSSVTIPLAKSAAHLQLILVRPTLRLTWMDLEALRYTESFVAVSSLGLRSLMPRRPQRRVRMLMIWSVGCCLLAIKAISSMAFSSSKNVRVMIVLPF